MDYFQLVAAASLTLQLVVLSLLFAGVWMKGQKRFRQHGITMLTAVVVHIIMILAWMIPSFSRFFSPSSINIADPIQVTTLVHALSGIAASLFGLWLVISWRLRADMKTCFAKKGIMRVTLTLWLIALLLGIILYLKIMQLF